LKETQYNNIFNVSKTTITVQAISEKLRRLDSDFSPEKIGIANS
jgi:hypothetical protein